MDTETFSKDIAPGLVARDVFTQNVRATKPVTSLALSPDGKYLAVGDAGGRVTLRDMERGGTLVIILNAGRDVGITCMTWLRAARPWTLFVASGNGYLNCVSFDDDEAGDFRPRNTAVRAPGLITCLCINDDSSQIAASYDQTTRIFLLPFTEGDPAKTGQEGSFLINQVYNSVVGVPVRDIQRAVGLQYIDRHALIVACFGSIKVHNTDPKSTRDVMWEIKVPDGTNIGSFALSPSRTYIVATNLHDGVDWYSIKGKQYISKTRIEDTYDIQNYILPVNFITDSTFVAGHNNGKLVMGTVGVERITSHGLLMSKPSKHLTVATSKGHFQVVYAVGNVVTAITYVLSEDAPASATPMVPPDMKDDLIKLSTTPPLVQAPQASSRTKTVGFADPAIETVPSRDHDSALSPGHALPSVSFDMSLASVDSVPFQTPGETPAAFGRQLSSAFFTTPVATGKSKFAGALPDLPTFQLDESGAAGLLATGGRGLGGGSLVGPERYPHAPTGMVSRPSTSWDLHDVLSPDSELSEGQQSPTSKRTIVSDMLEKRAFTSMPPPLQHEPLSVYYQHNLDAQPTRASQSYTQSGADRHPQFGSLSRFGGRLDDDKANNKSGRDYDEPRDTTHRPLDERTDDGGNSDARPTSSMSLGRVRQEVSRRLQSMTLQGWGATKANPKFAALILLSIIACILAMVSSRPIDRGDSRLILPSKVKNSLVGDQNVHTVGDDHGDDDDQGYDGDFEGGDEECDTIVLTETRLLTITKTVTSTVTSTVTTNARPTGRRSQKSRRH